MEKRLMLSALLIGMLLISLASVSAFEFDNIKSYNSVTKEVTIKNAFGLGDDIAKVKLNTPLDYHVSVGYQKVAEFEITSLQDYKEAVKSLELFDKKAGMKKIERDFDFKYLSLEDVEVEDYKLVCKDKDNCESVKTGSHFEKREIWKELNLKDLRKGEILKIGIFTEVKKNDKVEWIPNLFGVRVEEWAVWTEDMNVGLVSYWKMDESSGAMIDAVKGINNGSVSLVTQGSEGMINSGYSFSNPSGIVTINHNANLEPSDLSLCGWMNFTDVASTQTPGGKQPSVANGYWWQIDSSKMAFQVRDTGGNAQRVDGTINLVTNRWYFVCGTWDNTGKNLSIYVNGTLEGSDIEANSRGTGTGNMVLGWYSSGVNVFSGNLDEVFFYNKTLTGAEVSDLYQAGLSGQQYTNTFNLLTETLNSPVNVYNSSVSDVTFNCSSTDETGVLNNTLILDGVDNYTIINTTANENLSLQITLSLSDGAHTWNCRASDGENTATGTQRDLNVDTSLPVINNIAVNESGLVFGYPKMISVSSNITDGNLKNCWFNTGYNSTNSTFTCGSNFTLNNIPAGRRTINVFANDYMSWESTNSSVFDISYFTHNVTYKDNLTNGQIGGVVCSFLGDTKTGVTQAFDIHNTTSRAVNCSATGYSTFNFTLTESNMTYQNVSVSPVMLNLTFDAVTNATITWLGGSLSFTNTNNISLPMRNITALGNIQVAFNEGTQLFSFYNDNNTNVNASLKLESVDFDQPVKVLASSQEIKDAIVTFYKDGKITYSAFTDINGIAHILINDGTTYEIHAYKEGYDEYEELRYIPTSNTDTILINLIGGAGAEGDYYFATSCLNVIGKAQNCSFYVKSYKDTTIYFNYTWNGGSYLVSYPGSEATLTLIANSTTTPISVTASVNPTKSYSVQWSGLSSRSIQLDFNEEEIKDDSVGVLTLFYMVVFILGILIAVIVNRMPKLEGKGIWGMTIWLGIIALEFPLLWFIVTPVVIYGIFKTFWGDDE